jgi:sarcosine oxidase subunit gamma
VVSLIAKTPLDGLDLDAIGGLMLAEPDFEPITGIAALKGQKTALSKLLKQHCGIVFPAPNRFTAKAGARLVWFGLEHTLLIGTPADDAFSAHAAVTDQSDAWARLSIEGDPALDVLARVTSVDLRSDIFKSGHALRTHVGHMSAVLMRTGTKSYEIMVMRSMAKTLVHDIRDAALSVSALSLSASS